MESEYLKTKFSIYPNPTNSKINIEVNNNLIATSIKIVILDILGKEYLTDDLNIKGKELVKETIDLSSLQKGIYLVKIIFNNQNHIFKLIIDK